MGGGGGGFKERRKVREQGEMRINTHDYNLEVLEEPQHIEAIFGREKSFFLNANNWAKVTEHWQRYVLSII